MVMRVEEPGEQQVALTVRKLKQLLADWPEFDRDGEPTEVWVEVAPGLSSVVVEASPLRGSTAPDGRPGCIILTPVFPGRGE